MKKERYIVLYACILSFLILAGCSNSPTTYKTGSIAKIGESIEPSAEQIQPMQYVPVGFDEEKIELLENLPQRTKVTLINHHTGDFFHTKVIRSGTKSQEYPMQGRYGYSMLNQPAWQAPSLDDIWKQAKSITAIIGEHVPDIVSVTPKLLDDTIAAKNIDTYIREQGLLDSVLLSLGKADVAVYRDYLATKIPQIYTVDSGDKHCTLVSYSYELNYYEEDMGPKFLLDDNTVIPLLGNCASMPSFYTIGKRLYFRHITAQCESGYIVVGNYAVTGNGLTEEWLTYAYAN